MKINYGGLKMQNWVHALSSCFILLLGLGICSPVMADVPEKFQGNWLKNIDGIYILVQISSDKIIETECEGFSDLSGARKDNKNCYLFTDSGGDSSRICFSLKGKILTLKEEARGMKFTRKIEKFQGNENAFREKYCNKNSNP